MKLTQGDVQDMVEQIDEANDDDRDEDLCRHYLVCYPTIESQNS